MTFAATTLLTFQVVQCCKCGTQFGVLLELDNRNRATHEKFYCPAGHGQSYVSMSESERNRQSALKAQAEANEARHALLVMQKERDAAVAEQKRMEARVSGGVCPCCDHVVPDLKRHMKSKHKGAIGPGVPQKQIAGCSGK